MMSLFYSRSGFSAALLIQLLIGIPGVPVELQRKLQRQWNTVLNWVTLAEASRLRDGGSVMHESLHVQRDHGQDRA